MVKNPPTDAGDVGSIPGSGRFPGPRFQIPLDKWPLSPGTPREASGVPCLNPRRGLTLLSPVCRDPAIKASSNMSKSSTAREMDREKESEVKRDHKREKMTRTRTSLVVQWPRLPAPKAGGLGSIPGWRAKIPQAAHPSPRPLAKKPKISFLSLRLDGEERCPGIV